MAKTVTRVINLEGSNYNKDYTKTALETEIGLVNLALPKDSAFRKIIFRGVSADSVSVTPSLPSYNGYNIPGRSSPVQAYSGGEARSISFSIVLHRDMMEAVSYDEPTKQSMNYKIDFSSTTKAVVKNERTTMQYSASPYKEAVLTKTTTRDLVNKEKSNSMRFRDLLNQLEAMNYPRYSKGGVVPPKVYCKIGANIRIKGIPNITIQYQKPLDSFGRYMMATVSVNITEVLQRSFDNLEVINNMTRYGTYSKELR